MTKTKDSQPQKETASFDPMTVFGKLAEDHMARVGALYEQLGTWEASATERATATIGQLSSMTSETLAYASALSAEWRKLTLEATRRGAAMFTAR